MLGACDLAPEPPPAPSPTVAQTAAPVPSPVLAPEPALHEELEADDPDVIVVDLEIDDDAEPIDALLVNHSFVILAEVDVCLELPEDIDVAPGT